MKIYKTTESGAYLSDIGIIPNDEGNTDYSRMLKEVAAGEAEIIDYVEPKPTNDQLIAELENSVTPRNLRGAALGDAYALKAIKSVDDAIAKLRG